MFAFWKKKKKKRTSGNPVEAFRDGFLPCRSCGRDLPLGKSTPLAMEQCPHCNGHNLVPLHIAGYWLFSPLGAGAMGAVYEACHEEHEGRRFAVKVLPRDGRENRELIKNLTQEAKVFKEVSGHPCIVEFVEAGFEDGEHFVASGFADGERLEVYIDRVGAMPIDEVLLLGLRLLSAETHIYNKGYLYRDMKPENVIMTPDQGAVLYDYGIAMPLKEALHPEGDVFEGSIVYLPPERCIGEGERACSEIYSVGMVLFHAAAGHPMIDAQLSADEMRAIAIRHLSELRSGADLRDIPCEELRPVIEKMTRRQPHERYQEFAEVERELLDILTARFRKNRYGRLMTY